MSKSRSTSFITKKGGYKEIPEEVIRGAMIDVGLDPEEPFPPVVVKRGESLAKIWEDPEQEGGRVITVPRRMHKSIVPMALRHEFTHLALHSGPDVFFVDMSPEQIVRQ